MIDIIIVTYNSQPFLYKCLNSIQQLTTSKKNNVIIIDNNSIDQSFQLPNLFSNQIKVIQNKSNNGFASACNQGITESNGRYIFFLNPDTVLLNNVIDIFYEFMEKDENKYVWCVGAQLCDEKNNLSKSFGHFPTMIDVFTEQFGIKGLVFKSNLLRKKYKTPNLEKPLEVPFIMGCNMFVRRNVLEEIGLFNEQFFLNYEEVELSLRASKSGYKSMILPEAKIMHYSGKSFSGLNSYLSHLWYGQLIFFKLTKSHLCFFSAKIIHLVGSLLRIVFKLDKFYWIHFKKIWSLK